MTYRVVREIHFSYAHRLPGYAGKCRHLHGHNARAVIELANETLNEQGMVMDFYQIQKTLGEWIDRELDHKILFWEKDPLAVILQREGEPVVAMKDPPTAEAIARRIYEEAKSRRLPVARVTVWETPFSSAVYHE